MYKNIILDLDNTLCPCSHYYIDCQTAGVKFISKNSDIPESIVLSILKHIDTECTNLPNGFNRTRFPRSFMAASLVADVISGAYPKIHLAIEAFEIGNAVFDQPYLLFPGVWDMLTAYKEGELNIVLYTLGDYDVQRTKVTKNDLHILLGEENIHIVPKKEGNALDIIIEKHGFKKEETVMVGDSLRGDIGSANAAGIDSVWISWDAQNKWGYENLAATPTHIIHTVSELPTVIPYPLSEIARHG